MTMKTKKEVLRDNLTEWLATKPYSRERREITAQLAKTLKIHPRSVGRSMKREQLREKGHAKRAGRPFIYTPEVRAAVRLIFDEMGGPCAENMKPAIPTYIHWLIVEKRWSFSDLTEGLVKGVSVGTLKRYIAGFRTKDGTRRGYSSTRPSALCVLVPVRKSHTWVGLPPGYVQMDTVVHCGDLLSGDLIYSAGAVDFATYWSEYTAQWNKGEVATKDSAEVIHDRFPFPWTEMHPDSGTEFLNYHFFNWSKDATISMTRSEPYKKNDNMCIEERNGYIPRRYVGYDRLDDASLVALVSEILELACALHNHFRPVRRMISKERLGAKWKRKFEKTSKTPCQRVLEHKKVSDEDKQELVRLHESLNPLALKRKIDTLRARLRKLLS
jgi:hypothetical protein